MSTFDVGVVGGGLGGLVAAALLAQRGRTVCVLERARTLGGRAATHQESGFSFNLGAHAFYRGGPADRVLAGLGVRPEGAPPPTDGALAVLRGVDHGLPTGGLSLALTGLLSARGKLEGARLLSRLSSLDFAALSRVPLREWLDTAVRNPELRAVVEALVRVTSYANAPDIASAGVSLSQLAASSKHGVEYLHGGWQTLVEAVVDAAGNAGAVMRTGVTLARAERRQGTWTLLDDQQNGVRCRTLVLAVSPGVAASIVQSDALSACAESAIPAKAACLDVALESLPRPAIRFAVGVDEPLYFSVHSAVAKVAPDGRALVSAAKYLPAGRPSDAKEDRAELEAWLDHLQPGWRDRLILDRYLPSLVTAQAVLLAERGGYGGRPGVRVPDLHDAFVVGDWVGDAGLLLDAVLASADAAAQAIVRDAELPTVA